ncbi:hypothetical protein HZH66_001554 [Vespula vulgaris]|uniref:Uncharacterized protein n=1 Tax=Vespula vulgaris TaxID=7454 RepID=A0A834KTM6_VESVU|nr:hypothetical protein HZH66_001554 [Vespula vulgaris]
MKRMKRRCWFGEGDGWGRGDEEGVRAGLRQQSALPETAERCVLARRMVYGTEAYGVAVSGGGQLRISELLAAKADCGSAG